MLAVQKPRECQTDPALAFVCSCSTIFYIIILFGVVSLVVVSLIIGHNSTIDFEQACLFMSYFIVFL